MSLAFERIKVSIRLPMDSPIAPIDVNPANPIF